MNDQEKLNSQKAQLIEELLAVKTVMEELWLYHPDNPNNKDITVEYKTLQNIQAEVEKELKKLN